MNTIQMMKIPLLIPGQVQAMIIEADLGKGRSQGF
jgi:hypothetical protein